MDTSLQGLIAGQNQIIQALNQLQSSLGALQKPVVVAPPATSSSTGTPGQIAMDISYLYCCVADNTWKRVALSTF
jgi:hypothetical protein